MSVPYFSQWMSPSWVQAIVEDGADPCADPAWPTAGFDDPDEYRLWSFKTCGLACLESALSFWGHEVPARADLLRSAIKWGCYRQVGPDEVEGLTYAPFAEWVACDFGLRADVHGRLPLADLDDHLDDESLWILSVSPEIRYPERPNDRRGGHLVLVHGWDANGLRFHNPSGIPPRQADAYLDRSTFARFYAERGIRLSHPRGNSPPPT